MIYSILKEIAEEGSTNQKMEILKKYKTNPTLKRVLYLACSKRVKFYIKQIPNYSPVDVHAFPDHLESLDRGLDRLTTLSNRVLTGTDASNYLANILSNQTPENASVIERIIDKDLKIGMGSNINKIIPGLIEETPYMGAKPFDSTKAKELFKGNKKCFIQVKMDGRYNNAIIQNGTVTLESRQGETVILNAKFVEELKKFPDCVLNGELTIAGIDRLRANGIVASLIDITKKWDERTNVENIKKVKIFEEQNKCSYQDMMNRVVYTCWDTITIDEYYAAESNVPYHIRWYNLEELIDNAGSIMVRPVETVIVHNYDEALRFFQLQLNRGLEGAILKAYDGAWRDSKPVWQMKMKLEMTIDLRVTGFKYGTKGTKNENVISTLECVSEDGLLKASPSGLTEKLMKYVTDNQDALLGTIVEVECCGISWDSTGSYSLLHPRIGKNEFRDDKTIADTLIQIQAIENMNKGLS